MDQRTREADVADHRCRRGTQHPRLVESVAMKIKAPNHEAGFEILGAMVCLLVLGLIGGCAVAVVRDISGHAHPRVITDPEGSPVAPGGVEIPLPAIPIPGPWGFWSGHTVPDVVSDYSAPVLILISMDGGQVVSLAISLAPDSGTFMDTASLTQSALSGVPVTIQWSANMQDWEDVVTLPIQTGTTVRFTDYIPPAGMGFYRTRQ